MSAGTLSLTNNSAAVTGTGTPFNTELAAGDFIVVTVGGVPYTLPVKSVESATALTLVSVYTGPTQSGAAWYAVPRVALNMVTGDLVTQSAEALRGLNYDKQNWQQFFTADGDVVITLPDTSQTTGPSAKKLIAGVENRLLNTNNLSDVTDKTAALKNLLNNNALHVDKNVTTMPAPGTSVAGAGVRSSYSVDGEMLYDVELISAATIGQGNGASIIISYKGVKQAEFGFNANGAFAIPGNFYILSTNGPFSNSVNFQQGGDSINLSMSKSGLLSVLNLQGTSSAPQAALYCSAGYYCKPGISNPTTGGSVFNFNWTGALQAWIDSIRVGDVQLVNTSDRELKTEIEYLDAPTEIYDALSRVLRWRVATFKYKARGEIVPESKTKLGFIANDLVEVSPHCVDGKGLKPGYDPNDPKDAYSLDNTAQIAELTQAVQALAQQNIQLRADIDELKAVEKTS